MLRIESLIRPHLKKIIPYSSARDEYSGKEGIFLDANENSFGSVSGNSFNRYPDPYQQEVKNLLSDIYRIPADHIFLGNGSDEIIDLVIRLFCRPMIDSIIITPPTYGMYEVSARINEAGVINVPLVKNFQPDETAILKSGKKNTKILFLCSPNNPSGNNLRKSSVMKLISSFRGIILIDEAYSDFTGISYINQVKKFPNLIVMKTFSKAWGMAGLRLGIAFAQPEIIRYLNKIKPPYNINQATQLLAVKALKNKSKKDLFVQKILSQRKLLGKKLGDLSYVEKVYPSDANFILVKFSNSAKVFQYLLKNLIIVRDRSNVEQCGNSLRITVGTPFENKTLMEYLEKFPA